MELDTNKTSWDDDDESFTKEDRLSLSPTARMLHSPKFNCYIVIRMGCTSRFNVEALKAGLREHLPKHPRFASKMESEENRFGGKMRWVKVPVNLDDHFIVPKLDSNMEHPDQFLEDYISNLTTTPMDLSKPLWEAHILNVKTADADSVLVIRIHHSVGDGASLMSLLLACTRKTSNPDALPTVPTKKWVDSSSDLCWLWRFFLAIWSVITLIGHTLVDFMLFIATILFLKDTKTPVKGAPGVELTTKRFLHRSIGLDHIKQVKNAMNVTINDVLVGVTQAGLSRYLNHRYGLLCEKDDGGGKQKRNNLPKSIRLRANIMVNLRQTVDIQALADMMTMESKARWGWGNWVGYILIPFTIALQDDPLGYVRRAKTLIDRKKNSLEAVVTYLTASLLTKILGAKGCGEIAHRVFSNSTLIFSNLVGPLEDVSFYGHPVSYIAPNVYGHPHALHMHFQSYVDKMTICLAVDPDAIPDPNKLLDDFEESLKVMREAVAGKGLTKEAV